MRAEAECNATEDPEKVRAALSNIFPGLEIKGDDPLYVESENEKSGLNTLKEMVWDKKILDTVRGRLLKSEYGGSVTLLLNKQAAFAGRLGVCDEGESPLGPIKVTFSAGLVDWMSPQTREGKPI